MCSGVPSGVLKCWFSLVFLFFFLKYYVLDFLKNNIMYWILVVYIKENVFCNGFWCVRMLIFYWFDKRKMYYVVESGVWKCWFSIGCMREKYSVVDSGVLKCCFSILFNKGKMYYVVDSGVLKCWFSIGYIKEHLFWRGLGCVIMLMFYWLYKGKWLCSRFWCVKMLISYWF